MKESPAFIAALPRELSGLTRGWDKRELPGNIFVYTNDSAIAVCAGMGAARAALAVKAALEVQTVTVLISVGVAGACDPALRVGEIVRAGEVIDARTGERFSNSHFKQVLVTGSSIASVKEKGRLYASYRASAVDMEAATVARIARGHGLSFQAIKAISDDYDFEIDGLSRFATADGQFRELAFALHTAVRPTLWGRVGALARNSSRALKALSTELESQIEWYRQRG